MLIILTLFVSVLLCFAFWSDQQVLLKASNLPINRCKWNSRSQPIKIIPHIIVLCTLLDYYSQGSHQLPLAKLKTVSRSFPCISQILYLIMSKAKLMYNDCKKVNLYRLFFTVKWDYYLFQAHAMIFRPEHKFSPNSRPFQCLFYTAKIKLHTFSRFADLVGALFSVQP